MKTFRTFFYSVLLLAFLATGCEPADLEGELGTPFSKTEGLVGTWKVGKVIQHDLKAPATSAYKQLDLTDRFDFSNTRITFKGSPATFTVEATEGPIFLPESGTWSLNDPEFPTAVRLVGTDQKTVILNLGTTPRGPFPTVKIMFDRMARKDQTDPASEQEAIIRYDYELQRISQ